MSVYVCPIALVNAPAERVWRLLSDPASYALWWDAETRSIFPEGRARRGQKIYAQSKELGRRWDVHINVGMVDEDRRQIDLTTRLPLGITVYNHISCLPLDNESCRVSFG
jgi:hypothetical protein